MTPEGIDITEVIEDGVTTTTWRKINAQETNHPNEKLY